jgi:hypothetical protein
MASRRDASGEHGARGETDERVDGGRMLRVAYLVVSLVPTAAVVALAWYVVRAVSVRVVWREAEARSLDDEPAA